MRYPAFADSLPERQVYAPKAGAATGVGLSSRGRRSPPDLDARFERDPG
jgi:hypothetical protein